MGFFNRLLWVFHSPSKLFADIRDDKATWWQAWIWLSLIGVVAAYFLLPVSMIVIELNDTGLPVDQVDAQLDFLEKWGTALLATTPVTVLVQALIVFGLGYILVSILSANASFKKFFTIGLYASIIANCASVLNLIVVRMKGLDTIQSAYDAEFSVGLSFLAPEDGLLLKSLFSSFELFTIWALVVVAMGLMQVFEMSRKHAVICVIPLWLLFFLQRLMSVALGGVG